MSSIHPTSSADLTQAWQAFLEVTQASPRAVAIVGPTATGKTPLGVALAQSLGASVLSADSQLVYQELAIGTAKPTLEEQQGIHHHLMDLVPPTVSFYVADYHRLASPLLTQLTEAGITPVIVGGTGFYLRALLQDDFLPNVAPNPSYRDSLNQQALVEGPESLHRLLTALDPERAKDLHPNDLFRVIRALEIIHSTGQPVPKPKSKATVPTFWLGLTWSDRDAHRKHIDNRIDTMLKAGWLDEVRGLMCRYGPETHALTVAHGYPEWVQYLQGQQTFEDALTQVQINIHQYSRRQMTWFKRNPDIHWIDVGACPIPEIIEHVA